MSSGTNLTSLAEGTSLASVGDSSSDGVTIKMSHIGLVKTESGFIVRSFVTDLGRWMLVVAVKSVDTYPFLAVSDLTCHLEDTGIGVFRLQCATW